MPIDFPDLRSLRFAAKVHEFRNLNKEETENDYRNALADHVASRDFIESQEIRSKVGWNQWSDKQENDTLRRSGMREKT